MNKQEFVLHRVLQNGDAPETAVKLWHKTQEALMADWKLDKRSPGEAMQSLVEFFDTMEPKTRMTVFGLLRERYSEWTGERHEGRRWP